MSTNQTIHLQSYGLCPAKPAGELKAGDVTVWNFGITETLTEVTDVSAQFVAVKLTDRNGRVFSRRMKKSRLVGVAA